MARGKYIHIVEEGADTIHVSQEHTQNARPGMGSEHYRLRAA